jgi:glutamate synthase (NADPH/NADH)
VDYGHAEVQANWHRDPREYAIMSTGFVSDGHGCVKGINTVQVEWVFDEKQKRWTFVQIEGSERFHKADLVLLALGFTGPETQLLKQLNVGVDQRGNVRSTSPYATSVPGVFAAGDCRRGQSLVVWGIREGREAAKHVDAFLQIK